MVTEQQQLEYQEQLQQVGDTVEPQPTVAKLTTRTFRLKPIVVRRIGLRHPTPHMKSTVRAKHPNY